MWQLLAVPFKSETSTEHIRGHRVIIIEHYSWFLLAPDLPPNQGPQPYSLEERKTELSNKVCIL